MPLKYDHKFFHLYEVLKNAAPEKQPGQTYVYEYFVEFDTREKVIVLQYAIKHGLVEPTVEGKNKITTKGRAELDRIGPIVEGIEPDIKVQTNRRVSRIAQQGAPNATDQDFYAPSRKPDEPAVKPKPKRKPKPKTEEDDPEDTE